MIICQTAARLSEILTHKNYAAPFSQHTEIVCQGETSLFKKIISVKKYFSNKNLFLSSISKLQI